MSKSRLKLKAFVFETRIKFVSKLINHADRA